MIFEHLRKPLEALPDDLLHDQHKLMKQQILNVLDDFHGQVNQAIEDDDEHLCVVALRQTIKQVPMKIAEFMKEVGIEFNLTRILKTISLTY